jgi:hypothetical protein
MTSADPYKDSVPGNAGFLTGKKPSNNISKVRLNMQGGVMEEAIAQISIEASLNRYGINQMSAGLFTFNRQLKADVFFIVPLYQ